MRRTILTLASLLTTIHALQITSPALGASVDPSKPITVTWVSSPSDPATFNLLFSSADAPFAINSNDGTTVGSNIQTSTGSFTIPANTVSGFGAGFSLSARSASGDNIGSSGTFLLGYSSGRVVTGSNGQFSLAPSPTGGSTSASTTLESLTFDTSGVTGSMTATYFSSTNIVPTVGTGTASSSLSSFTFTDVTGSMTIQPTSSSNRASSVSSAVSSAASSASSSASRSSASAASTANSQPRIGVGKEVAGVAGLLAGLVAVIA